MSRLLFLGILIYFVAIAGLATLTGSVLALVIPLLIMIGASLIFGPETPNLDIQRELSTDRIDEHGEFSVTLTVTNRGAPLELVTIQDAPPTKLDLLDGDIELLTSLKRGETAVLNYTLRGKRGRYDFGEVVIKATDFLRVFRREVSLQAPGHVELFVYPNVHRLERIPIRPRQTKAYAGPIPARLGGSGIDFFGVRHYQPGDALRHVNWRANARHPDTFFTNEFEQERVADVGIILDARQRSNIEVGDASLFEFTIEATASLANAFLTDGNRVAMLRYGDFLDWTVPGYGKMQQDRILKSLARAQTGDSQVFDQLENLPARLFPAKSQVVLVSPLVTDDTKFLPRLRARGYSVMVISPDPVSFEIGLLERSELLDTAVRIAQVERELLLRKLRQSGIQVLNWDVSIPFDRAMGAQANLLRPYGQRNVGIIS